MSLQRANPRSRKNARRTNGKRTNVKQTPLVNRAQTSMGQKVLLGSFQKVDLIYADADSQRNNPANSYLAFSFRINDVYDPDPLILSGGITGFNEMSAFFSRFHVEEVEVDIVMDNQEQFPLTVCPVFAPTDLVAAIGSRSLAVDAMERWGAIKPIVLGHVTGQDRYIMQTLRIKPSMVLGNPALYNGDPSYTGTNSSSPTSFVFLTIVAVGPATVSLTNGMFITTTIRYKVRFFSLAKTLFGFSSRAEVEVLLAKYREAYKQRDYKTMTALNAVLSFPDARQGPPSKS